MLFDQKQLDQINEETTARGNEFLRQMDLLCEEMEKRNILYTRLNQWEVSICFVYAEEVQAIVKEHNLTALINHV